jgi:hypothetical protein
MQSWVHFLETTKTVTKDWWEIQRILTLELIVACTDARKEIFGSAASRTGERLLELAGIWVCASVEQIVAPAVAWILRFSHRSGCEEFVSKYLGFRTSMLAHSGHRQLPWDETNPIAEHAAQLGRWCFARCGAVASVEESFFVHPRQFLVVSAQMFDERRMRDN